MIVGYARISTGIQKSENQLFELDQYSQKMGVSFDRVVSETISSRQKLENRALSKLIATMKAGDTLIVTEISRIGRSLYEVMGLLGDMLGKGLQVYSIKQNWHLGNNMISKVQAMGFTLSADLERELISKRTKDGLARAKANGKELGHPRKPNNVHKLSGQEEQIRDWLAQGKPKSEIASGLGVDRQTLSNHLQRMETGLYIPKAYAKRPPLVIVQELTNNAIEHTFQKAVSNPFEAVVSDSTKFWAYIRVSSDKQTNENQRLQIDSTAKKMGINISEWCEEVISSRIKLEARSVWDYVNRVSAGDVLIISEISRLGRSISEIARIFEMLIQKKVCVFSLRDNYLFADNTESKTIIGCMSIAVQIERELISQRTTEALKLRKAQGVVLGRPKGVKNCLDYHNGRFRALLEPYKERILEGAKRWETIEDMTQSVGDKVFTKNSVETYMRRVFECSYPALCEKESGWASRTLWAFMTNIAYIEKAMQDGKRIVQICKKIGIASPKFIEHFTNHFGQSIFQYRASCGKNVVRVHRKKNKAVDSCNWHNKTLLATALTFASPEQIAKQWGCAAKAITHWKKKHGL